MEEKLEKQAGSRDTSVGRSLVALILGAMAIGFAPIFVRYSEVGPTATAFWRILLALPVVMLWCARERRHLSKESIPWLLLALVGLMFALDLSLWHWSIHFTTVANATLETNLAAVFVPLLGWLFFRQQVSRKFLFALMIAIAGTVLLVGKNAHITPTTLRGDALGVTTALFYAGYILSVKAARDRGIGTGSIMAIGGVVTALILLAITLLTEDHLFPASARGWIVLCALGWISQLGGQSLITYSLAGLPASLASLGLLIQPATAAIAAWMLLGESLAPAQLAGGVVLLIGLWLAKGSGK